MIKNIIFDFNGTILDDVQISFDALNACNTKFLGAGSEITMKYYKDTFSFPVGDYYVSMGYDFNKLDFVEVADYFHDYYGNRWKECHIFPDFLETVKQLKEKGINVYIITASYRPLIEAQLKYFNIEDLFTYVIAIDDKFGGSKVDVAKKYFSSHPINLDETIMVGDTLHDYEVANNLGIKPILYCSGHNSKEFLEKGSNGTKIIASHDELLDLI